VELSGYALRNPIMARKRSRRNKTPATSIDLTHPYWLDEQDLQAEIANEAERYFLGLYKNAKSFSKSRYASGLIDILRAVDRLMGVHRARLMQKPAKVADDAEKDMRRDLARGLRYLGLSVHDAETGAPIAPEPPPLLTRHPMAHAINVALSRNTPRPS